MAKDDKMKYYLIREDLLKEVLEALDNAAFTQDLLCDNTDCSCGIGNKAQHSLYYDELIEKIENSSYKVAK